MLDIRYPENKDYSAYFDNQNKVFEAEWRDRNKRPNLFERFIYIDERISFFGYTKSFWHAASIGADDDASKFEMYPCTNSSAYSNCTFMCDCDHDENFMKEENSIPCMYRAAQTSLLKFIINLANTDKENECLRIWKQKNTRKRENNLKIRIIVDELDYVVIFKIDYNENKTDIRQYRLITAYPVVLKSYKKRFDREYEESLKKKK